MPRCIHCPVYMLFKVNFKTFFGVGTNRGVILLNMETGASSWVLRCKSDVMSMQLEQSVSQYKEKKN